MYMCIYIVYVCIQMCARMYIIYVYNRYMCACACVCVQTHI